MAWKKTRDSSFGITWEKMKKNTKEVIVLSSLQADSEDWRITIIKSDLDGDDPEVTSEEFFDTKQKAINTAKKYMRTH